MCSHLLHCVKAPPRSTDKILMFLTLGCKYDYPLDTILQSPKQNLKIELIVRWLT
jgi:hypothetical protein